MEVIRVMPFRIWTVLYTWFAFKLRSLSSTADFHKSASICAYASGMVVGSVSSVMEFVAPAKMWFSSSLLYLVLGKGQAQPPRLRV